MNGFIPDAPDNQTEVPFFEDATTEKHGVRGHGTGKSIETLKAELTSAMGRLGGGVVSIIQGKFPTSPPRYGFRISFTFSGQHGRMEIAALPFRYTPTTRKKEQALKQALFMAIYALEAQYFMLLMSPGSMPLMPYMIVPGTDRTVAEVFLERGDVPRLGAGVSAPIEGEIVELD